MMAAPVGIQSDICYTSDTHEFLWGYESEELTPHGGEVDEVTRLSEVLLGNLQLSHLLGLLDIIEDRCVWLTRLEVEWTVLGLQDDVIPEVSIEFNELRYSLFNAILTLMLGTIYKASPHDDTSERLYGISQCVGPVCMCTLIVEGTRLSFGIGLDEETTEVRNQLIDLLGLSLPPALDLFVQWVSGLHGFIVIESLGRDGHG